MKKNFIHHGDCIAYMRRISDKSVDFVLTDPPYLVNYQSRDGRTISNDKNDQWLKPAYEELYRILKPNSFCVSFYGWNKIDRFMTAWRAAGFYPVGHIVWKKCYISKRAYLAYRHESAYLLAKGRPEQPRWPMGDVLHWCYSGNKHHPTEKPITALKPIIRAFSKEEDIVFDPFAGSGSTGVAARECRRRFFGCEIEKRYAEIANARVQEAAA